jgi:hypothetical protein
MFYFIYILIKQKGKNMTDGMLILKKITNRDEMSGIIHFLINKKEIVVKNPVNTDLSFDSQSKTLTSSNVQAEFFELKWNNLFFKIFTSFKNGFLEFDEINIFQDKNQYFLPQLWNNIVTIDGSVFIGDILFFEDDKIFVEFDVNTFITSKLNQSPATIIFNDDVEVITLLECHSVLKYNNKTHISFFIKEDFLKIQSVFERGNDFYIKELLDLLWLDIFKYRNDGT